MTVQYGQCFRIHCPDFASSSALLTSATDLLLLDLCKAVWLGLGLPDWMMWDGVLGLGPQMVKWPDCEKAVSQWGVLMGLLLS